VRGAFGSILRKLVCVPGCRDARACDVRANCPYARIFEPQAARPEGPSGFSDWPRPFVFRASHLDGRTIRPGDAFHFDVHIFDVRDPPLPYFIATFVRLGIEGLGPSRAYAELTAVDQLDPAGVIVKRIFQRETGRVRTFVQPIAVDLDEAPEPVTGAKVRFVTPTELKCGGQVVERPEFGVLFGRLRDRISALSALYGECPLEIDFRGMGERAAEVRITSCSLRAIAADRLSSRTGQRHSLGGFVGEVEYEGDLGEFLCYLKLGHWVGVGRQTVWGKGDMEVL